MAWMTNTSCSQKRTRLFREITTKTKWKLLEQKLLVMMMMKKQILITFEVR